ncbi:MAG: NADH-quinone oxidoreductase subunit J [Candidatus Binatia bacterium]
MSIGDALFYVIAAVTVVSAAGVAFSPNIVYSAFSLMGTFMGVAGLYVFLAADFVAVIQVLIYVGGILVLLLFAVMLTHSIGDVRVSNRSVGRLPAMLVIAAVTVVMGMAVTQADWKHLVPAAPKPTVYTIGNAFLGGYLLPFELASVVLLAALIGAVILSRKELKE